jgi:5-(carboxyamino)imidazole ribonucleotide synthase
MQNPISNMTATTVSREDASPVPAGGTIGILGGGQLGRMAAIEAARLGYHTHVYSPEQNSPAAEVSRFQTCAPFDDWQAVEAFAKSVDVITCEMEHVPAETLKRAAEFAPLRPGVRVFEICQNRIAEKSFLNEIGIDTAAWHPIESKTQLIDVYNDNMDSGILKIAYAGYDGKGQARLEPGLSNAALEQTWSNIFGQNENQGLAIYEKIIPFERELSVIVARSMKGEMAAFDTVENIHKDHILSVTHAPAPVTEKILESAKQVAFKIAEALDIRGVLAVEMFLSSNGEILVNELAPRPHNSGHWTIDACLTDQFGQLVRAICGLPLGSSQRIADAEMINLIGDDIKNSAQYLDMPNARLHVYGKDEIRSGRKMGHVTIVKPISNK